MGFVVFSISEVRKVPAATILATLPAPNPGVVSSFVTVTETTSTGTVLAPATFTVTPPAAPAANGGTFTFTSGLGSTLNATQVDTNAAGLQSPPTVTPPYLVTNPAPPAPSGPIAFVVTGTVP